MKKMQKQPPSPIGGAQVQLGHSLAGVKIWGRNTPYGSKYGLPKNAI